MMLQQLFSTVVGFVLLTTSSGWAKPCISIDNNEHCYNIVDSNITWNKASRICKEDDGHLITIETAEEQQFIAGQVQKRNFKALALWIGLENVRSEDGRTWVNLENVSYDNWAKEPPSITLAGNNFLTKPCKWSLSLATMSFCPLFELSEPNTPPGDEKCVEISTFNFKWYDTSCTRKGGYICEKTGTSSVFDGTSYLVVFGISVATVSALVLHVCVLLHCCLMNKRKMNQNEKKVKVYQVLQEMETRNSEHVYNQHLDLSGTYCTIDDYSSRPDDLTQRKEIYNN